MRHVLVVDDNALSLQFFSDALATLGIACTTAGDGASAVALATPRRFDLMLIDACMPGLDGIGTLHAIRAAQGASSATPAVATTAAPDLVRPALIDAGFIDVLGKPLTLAMLEHCIMRHLRTAARPAADLLDDAAALAVAGDDVAIVAALRGLLAGELDRLPAELAVLGDARDLAGLQERLHRLAASAGFCGAHDLAGAVAGLGRQLAIDTTDPRPALANFLETCRATRAALACPGGPGQGTS